MNYKIKLSVVCAWDGVHQATGAGDPAVIHCPRKGATKVGPLAMPRKAARQQPISPAGSAVYYYYLRCQYLTISHSMLCLFFSSFHNVPKPLFYVLHRLN